MVNDAAAIAWRCRGTQHHDAGCERKGNGMAVELLKHQRPERTGSGRTGGNAEPDAFSRASLDGDGSGWDAYLRYSALTVPMIKARGARCYGPATPRLSRSV